MASGGVREPPIFYLINLLLAVPSVFLLKPVFYFLIYLFVTRQDGVPKGTPPYPPVAREIKCEFFTLIFIRILTCFAPSSMPRFFRTFVQLHKFVPEAMAAGDLDVNDR